MKEWTLSTALSIFRAVGAYIKVSGDYPHCFSLRVLKSCEFNPISLGLFTVAACYDSELINWKRNGYNQYRDVVLAMSHLPENYFHSNSKPLTVRLYIPVGIQRFALLFLISCLMLCISTDGLATGIVSQPDVRKYNIALGKSVFQGKCIKCHGDLNSEAPQLGVAMDWKKRISIPVDILIKHAIEGHGKMPPKGGFEALATREISAAVAYIVDQSRRLLIRQNGEVIPDQANICGDAQNTKSCARSQVDNTLLMQMLWMITGQNK